jgi:hypothetical protein
MKKETWIFGLQVICYIGFVALILVGIGFGLRTFVDKENEQQYQYSPSGDFDCAIFVDGEQQYEYVTQVVKFKYGVKNKTYYFEWHYDYDEPITVYSSEPIKFQCWVD